MARFIDPLINNNLFDANILDGVADGLDADVNEIVQLAETGEITVLLPYSVQNELANPNTPSHVRRAAAIFGYTCKVPLTDEERRRHSDLVAAVKGDAEEKNIAPDLFHVCETAKYGGYFITCDKRLLARSDAIAGIVQIDVVKPAVFIERVAEARQRAARFGER
jgi:hypothetical protein